MKRYLSLLGIGVVLSLSACNQPNIAQKAVDPWSKISANVSSSCLDFCADTEYGKGDAKWSQCMQECEGWGGGGSGGSGSGGTGTPGSGTGGGAGGGGGGSTPPTDPACNPYWTGGVFAYIGQDLSNGTSWVVYEFLNGRGQLIAERLEFYSPYIKEVRLLNPDYTVVKTCRK